MQKRTTFESLQFEHETNIMNALHSLYTARTNEEIEVSGTTAIKAIQKYTRNLKQFTQESSLLLISDQAKMQEMLNDLLRSKDFVLSYEPLRNVVRWTVQTPYHSKYNYISKFGSPVDLNNWSEWIRNLLMQ